MSTITTEEYLRDHRYLVEVEAERLSPSQRGALARVARSGAVQSGTHGRCVKKLYELGYIRSPYTYSYPTEKGKAVAYFAHIAEYGMTVEAYEAKVRNEKRARAIKQAAKTRNRKARVNKLLPELEGLKCGNYSLGKDGWTHDLTVALLNEDFIRKDGSRIYMTLDDIEALIAQVKS